MKIKNKRYFRCGKMWRMVIKHFLDYIQLEKHYSAHTIRAYRTDLLQFCTYLGVDAESFDPRMVTEQDVREWLIALLQNETPQTVNRKISSLKALWRFCMKTAVLEKDILRKLISPKKKRPLPVFYKDSEMTEVLSQPFSDDFEEVRDHLIIRMFYETGIRCSELVGLKDADVDLEGRTLRVLGKRNKQRIIPFGDGLAAEISNYMHLRVQQFGDDTVFLFVRKNGEPLYPELVYNMVHRRMSQVSTLHKQSPHVLRHTFATTMLNHGADIDAVKELLGHANLAATQIYTHATFDEIHNIYKHAHPRA